MKKFFLVAIAVAGAWGVFQANQNNNVQLSDLQLENVEALAQRGYEITVQSPCFLVNPYICYPDDDYLMKGVVYH
ncbi:MAG: NVEALA domain-containing protein [Bacteroidales bacterium]|nr:NVEALA domain-containing protein [Bacteroidales bacterium]